MRKPSSGINEKSGTVGFHSFLMMAYAWAETSNKTMFSIIVAVLFAISVVLLLHIDIDFFN